MLGAYGWDDRWAALFARFAESDTQPGRIVRQDRATPLVATATGLVHLPVRRNVAALTVGDWVVVEDGVVIVDLLERSSLLRRRDPGGVEQLLAANVDVVAMVFGADRPLKAGRIFRTRTQIWDSGAAPLVVLTKTDLIEDDGGVDALNRPGAGDRPSARRGGGLLRDRCGPRQPAPPCRWADAGAGGRVRGG